MNKENVTWTPLSTGCQPNTIFKVKHSHPIHSTNHLAGYPPPPENDNLNRFFFNITDEIELLFDTPITDSMPIPTHLRHAMKQLQDDPNIIIKLADKCGATVVLNTHDYHKKVLQILTDKNFCKQMTHNNIPTVRQEIQSLIDYPRIKGTIDDKTFTFSSPKNFSGHHCSSDYPKYTSLNVLSDLLFQPMTLPQRTYHPMLTISYNNESTSIVPRQ